METLKIISVVLLTLALLWIWAFKVPCWLFQYYYAIEAPIGCDYQLNK